MNYPKEIKRYCPKCKKHTTQKVSIYKAGKRRASAIGERRHAEDKKGYGGQKFPKLAKPAKVTKKVTRILTCPECKKKFNTYGKESKRAKRCSMGNTIVNLILYLMDARLFQCILERLFQMRKLPW